jgi:SpoVK/Ycf46/Vps4 family AAA+-type ATPase
MTGHRLDSLRLDGADPMVVLYGTGVDDLFVGDDYQLRTLPEALVAQLRGQGFDRVVFNALRRPVFFLDERSRSLSRRAAPAGAARPGMMRNSRLTGGPFGQQVVAPVAAEPPASGSRVLTDPHSVMMVDHFVRQSTIRTAIVFTQAEETLRYLKVERTLAGMFAEWLSNPASNLVVLVFRRDSLQEVREFVDGLGRFPRLESFVAGRHRASDGHGSLRIGAPLEDELARLVQVLRLREGLRIGDWRELPSVLRAMAAAPGAGVRDWQHRLRDVELRMETLRRNGWVDAATADHRSAWQRLTELRGLGSVATHLERLRWQVAAENTLAASGAPVEASARHLVFTGNPGTGKTTVARLVGEIYRDLGVLRRGHVVEAEAAELIAEHVGGSAKATNRKVDEALDGVLFIDEAYRLTESVGGFGKEAVETLLTRMENERDRLVVIVAGYPERMDSFLTANPGLDSRFPLAGRIAFPDYGPEDLYAILRDQLSGLPVAPEAETEMRLVTRTLYDGRDRDFGNARAMRDIAAEIRGGWMHRIRGDVTEPIRAGDMPDRLRSVGTRTLPSLDELYAELTGLVGLGPVKELIMDLSARLQLRQRRGTGEITAPHLLFLGPPGTGKTTVARLMGRMFRSLGLLRSGHVIEVNPRVDLVAEWIGQTGPKTQAAVRRAVDGILFIDEAYSLTRDQSSGRDFGTEVLDVLVPEMQNRRGRLVVIAAGYPALMERFLSGNPGLPSRFGTRVVFPGYSDDELVEILCRRATKDGFALPPPAREAAGRWFAATRRRAGDAFGNAREVDALFDAMETRLAHRGVTGGDVDLFAVEDVPDVDG